MVQRKNAAINKNGVTLRDRGAAGGNGAMKTVAKLRDRLRKLHERTAETPLFNPVFQLSHDLSRELENAGTLDDMEAWSPSWSARRCKAVPAPAPPGGADQPDENLARVAALWTRKTASAVPRPLGKAAAACGVHRAPTFLLNPAQADAVATAALADDPLAHGVCPAGQRPQDHAGIRAP
jgi:phosphoenolpyruvate carboxylase